MGAVALLAGGASVGAMRYTASADNSGQANTRCIGTFEASTVSAKADTFATRGLMEIEIGRDDIRGILETQDGNRIRFTGATIGNGIFLTMELSDGAFVYGFGSAANLMRDCRGGMGGLFSVGGRAISRTAINDTMGRWEFQFERP
jgi:hypothetical protein